MADSKTSETQAFLRLVLTTLTLIVVLTFINGIIVVNMAGTNIFKPLKRNLAAVAERPPFNPEKIESPVIEINCWHKLKPIFLKTKAPSARVSFKNCKKIGRLLNESNQNQGDVFPLKKNHWTSDFIFLNQGKNRINAPLGDSIQTIEITREIANKETGDKAL